MNEFDRSIATVEAAALLVATLIVVVVVWQGCIALFGGDATGPEGGIE